MKKITIIIGLLLILTSCGMTQEEKLQKIKDCKELGYGYRLNDFDEIVCSTYKQDKIFDCIREYTNGLDEKYNNPDTVSDLREDKYSQVVKTCNETFGEEINLNK